MVLRILFICLSSIFSAASADAAVSVDEHGSTTRSTRSDLGVGGARRAAVGLSAGGLSGIFGFNLELNFTRATGLHGGYGWSSDYQSLHLGIKHVLAGESLLPYVAAGYARWFAGGDQGAVGKTTPKFVGERFLSPSEQRSGRFAENLLYANAGLQLLKRTGDWAGSAVYLEAVGLVDVDDLLFEPTFGLGYLYYF